MELDYQFRIYAALYLALVNEGILHFVNADKKQRVLPNFKRESV